MDLTVVFADNVLKRNHIGALLPCYQAVLLRDSNHTSFVSTICPLILYATLDFPAKQQSVGMTCAKSIIKRISTVEPVMDSFVDPDASSV
jgi:uncharacterized protein (DUF302 family)